MSTPANLVGRIEAEDCFPQAVKANLWAKCPEVQRPFANRLWHLPGNVQRDESRAYLPSSNRGVGTAGQRTRQLVTCRRPCHFADVL